MHHPADLFKSSILPVLTPDIYADALKMPSHFYPRLLALSCGDKDPISFVCAQPREGLPAAPRNLAGKLCAKYVAHS